MNVSAQLTGRRVCGIMVALSGLTHPAKLLAQCEVQRLPTYRISPNGHFGSSVAFSGDWAVIGAPDEGVSNAGAAYIYRFDGPRMIRQQRLTASDAARDGRFGISVSVDGNVAVIGASNLNCRGGSHCDAAYLFRFNGAAWVQEQKLTASDRAPYDYYGSSVSVSGNVVVVGAWLDDCTPTASCGAAYVYRFDGLTWVEEEKLTPSDLAPGDEFGVSVSVSGNVIVVGADKDDCAGAYDCGAAYVYRFDGSSWVEEQKLTAGSAGTWFGTSVSVSGDVIVAGTPFPPSLVRVYRFNGLAWIPEQRLTASDAQWSSGFGGSISVVGDLAVVGARGVSSAYVFRFNGSSWVEVQKLTASDAVAGDEFGSSVAVGGDLAVVGARLDDYLGGFKNGSAYVFALGPDCNTNDQADFCDIRDGNSRDIDGSRIPDECEPSVPTQCELEKLTAPDAAPYDSFGLAVSVNDSIALVGAPVEDCPNGAPCGAAHLYRFGGSTWDYEQSLTGSDTAAYDQFGISVSVQGDVAVVGANDKDCAAGDSCGAAYVFRFDGLTWVEEEKLIASDPAAYDRFGSSVSVYGDAALVGAFWVDCAAGFGCGAAYVYRFNGSNWIEEQKLTASDAQESDFFGYSVSVSGNVVLVGALLRDCPAGDGCGAAYVYRFNGSTWVEEQKLTPSDAAGNDRFGTSVSVSGNVAVIGAWLSDCAAGSNCGAAYVYRFNPGAPGTWVEEQKLTASDANGDDNLGLSVSVSGDVAVVGAYGHDCSRGPYCGAAYLYRFNGSTWIEERKLTAPDASSYDDFGFSVSVSGETAVVGAYLDDHSRGPDSGSAYLFTLGADCNSNDRADVCDIRDSRSLDDNKDGVPDECTLSVNLDIKPGACPNPFNPKSPGVLPVAVVGSSTIDVTQIDTDSLVLRRSDGMGGSIRPLSGPPGPGIRFEDVATPFAGAACGCHELGPDGIEDMSLKFSATELVASLELRSLPRGTTLSLTLTGSMDDGTPFEASDCIFLTGRFVTPNGVKSADEPAAARHPGPSERGANAVPTPVGRVPSKD